MKKKRIKKLGYKPADYLVLLEDRDVNPQKAETLHDLVDLVFVDSLKHELESSSPDLVRQRCRHTYPAIAFAALPFEFYSGKRKPEYGDFIAAADYIHEEVLSRIQEEIDRRYPAIYDRSAPAFQKIEETFEGRPLYRMSTREKAFGNEKRRKSLYRAFLFSEDLINKANQLASDLNKKKVTFVDEGEDHEKNKWSRYIYTPSAAREIKMEGLFSNFYRFEQPVAYIKREIDRIAKEWLRRNDHKSR